MIQIQPNSVYAIGVAGQCLEAIERRRPHPRRARLHLKVEEIPNAVPPHWNDARRRAIGRQIALFMLEREHIQQIADRVFPST